jgi:RHS repeat-associated protein
MPLRFPGQYADEESGLNYNYFRDYDPTLGRYLQSDPIGPAGGLNTYGYVGGNPLRWVDPRGERATTVSGAALNGAVARATSAVIQCMNIADSLGPGGRGGAGPGSWPWPILLSEGDTQEEPGKKKPAEGEDSDASGDTANPAGDTSNPPVPAPAPDTTPAAEEAPADQVGEDTERNPRQDKPLTDGDIKKLIDAGVHPHELKNGDSKADLYKDTKGNIYVKLKGGSGDGDPTGYNINKF